MTFQYTCNHFNIKELVSEEVYNQRGEKAWQLFDPHLLMTIDNLREKYGPITINDWSWGGTNNSRGLRTPSSKYYSTFSQHSHGRAADLIFSDVTAEMVRQDILDDIEFRREPYSIYPDPNIFRYINSFEEGTSWLHIDVRNVDRLMTFPVPIT